LGRALDNLASAIVSGKIYKLNATGIPEFPSLVPIAVLVVVTLMLAIALHVRHSTWLKHNHVSENR
jgi:hypothetical protein